jgi:hypothetical protein
MRNQIALPFRSFVIRIFLGRGSKWKRRFEGDDVAGHTIQCCIGRHVPLFVSRHTRQPGHCLFQNRTKGSKQASTHDPRFGEQCKFDFDCERDDDGRGLS